jgi:3-oxoacid CoA-transferase B subunit
MPPGREVVYHSENGMLGMGPSPGPGEGDPDLINAAKGLVTLLPGGSYFHHTDSFMMMRGGHIDISVLGAFEVSAGGDLANWSTGDSSMPPAVGGAMDLAVGAKQVLVTMTHVTKHGSPKILETCRYPLTAAAVVSRIYTDLAVIEVEPGGALEAGFSPGTTIDGLDAYVASAQGGYLPGGEHEVEATTLRAALVQSSNRAAVHLLQRVGLGATIDLASRFGLDHMPAVPSLALGTGEVSLLNLTSAYTAFANGGVLQPPVFVTRVEDPEGRVIYRGVSVGRRVLSESTAYLMASMLADVVNHGTGYSARQSGFSLPAGGKTGTTDDHSDAWFVGFTPHLAAGVWVGFDRPQQIMRRGFASVVAVPAWAGFMKAATTGSKADWLEPPSGVTRIRRCRESGGLANEYCELHSAIDEDYVSIGRTPEICPLHSSVSATPLAAPATPLGIISYTIRRPQ